MEHITKFDIDRFDKHKDAESECWEFTESDGTKVTQCGDTDYVEKRLKPNAIFLEYRLFNSSGTIQVAYMSFWNSGFIKGSIKHYNESGDLIREENADLPYIYSWEDIKQLSTKLGILPHDERTYIQRYKDKESEKYVWSVSWNTYEKGEYPIRTLIIDGKNGKILNDYRGQLKMVVDYD